MIAGASSVQMHVFFPVNKSSNIFGSWIAEKAGRAQKAAENGKQRKLHNDVKQLTGKGNKQTAAVIAKMENY